MKIAKKVLALVMALAMVACFACVSFAAQNPTIVATATEEDGMIKVVLTAKDAVGMASFDVVLEYDAAVLTYSFADNGADAVQMNDTKKNSFTYEVGDTENASGKLLVGGYFKTNLKSAADAAADAKPGKTVAIDDKTFDLVVVYFELVDAEAYKASVKVSGGFGMGENKDDAVAKTFNAFTKTVTLKEEPTTKAPETTTKAPETTTEAPETTTKAPVADKETTTKAPVVEKETTTKAPSTSTEANPNTGDKPTGDNMALAAAFGVVALAGAAFVFTKKRK
ncbi:MAG: LPXTG cell wall anchor domain-containing protein [Clostridia bacterium]|nr:LPXTG cell wall anchor domain-containing protein [Clostridia bacterium]